MRPKLVPVIDVMGGVVVRAVGGRRDEYAEWRSPLCGSSDPETVARCLLARAGADTLYVADLDFMRWGMADWDRRFLSELSATVLLDDGGLSVGPGRPNVRNVVASEMAGRTPASVRADLRRYGPGLPPAFSIDLNGGKLVGPWAAWVRRPTDVLGFADKVCAMGFRTLIVLDVAAVGTGGGPVTADVCERLREAFPHVELVTGGGVRSWDDVDRLGDAGADAVLVASALHDGTLGEPKASRTP